MFKTAKACKWYQVATLPSPASIPADLTPPVKAISDISFKGYTDQQLKDIILSPDSNGALPGLSISIGQLALLPENYLQAYHNHLIHGHDLPDGLMPVRAGDVLVLHPYALGAWAVLCKLLMGLVRYSSKSIDPEDKKDAVDYHAWYKRCEYQLKVSIRNYANAMPPELVLGSVIYESSGVETFEMLYSKDRFDVWKNNSIRNTLESLTDYWFTNRTQPPSVLP